MTFIFHIKRNQCILLHLLMCPSINQFLWIHTCKIENRILCIELALLLLSSSFFMISINSKSYSYTHNSLLYVLVGIDDAHIFVQNAAGLGTGRCCLTSRPSKHIDWLPCTIIRKISAFLDTSWMITLNFRMGSMLILLYFYINIIGVLLLRVECTGIL